MKSKREFYYSLFEQKDFCWQRNELSGNNLPMKLVSHLFVLMVMEITEKGNKELTRTKLPMKLVPIPLDLTDSRQLSMLAQIKLQIF